MILLLGNNECVRHDVLMSLFIKKYYVTEHLIEDAVCLTKPFMTVYLNPSSIQLSKIKNENTVCVVAKNNMRTEAPPWMHVIPYGKDTAREIMRIYEEKCIYGKGREIFGIICMEGKRFAIGGAYVYLTPKQLKAIKILIYNSDKAFSSYDLSSYFDFVGDADTNFKRMMYEINNQCRRKGREFPIVYENDRYRISPNVLIN